MADTFTGFPPGSIEFLAGLAADNTRAYFDANRGSYDNDVAAPLRALVIAVGERLRDKAVPDLCFDPSTGKSLFRINRDTRFSADKTPYYPWVDAIWWAGPGDARSAPAFIFRLSASYLVAGAGIMGLARHPARPLPRGRRRRVQRTRPARPAGSTLQHA